MKYFFAILFSTTLIFLFVFGTNCFYGYLFPFKYSQEISSASEKYGVEQAIVYSMINIESRFNKNAVSNKGAVGLMQLMPSTAEMVAKQIELQEFDLKNPKDNIEIGVAYLSSLLKRFENLETALCAYNAGPTNVANWLNDKSYSQDGKTLTKIPFKETRNYIERFKTNYRYYKTKKQDWLAFNLFFILW